MINFKQFLEESRSAPLYHGTSIGGLRGIFHMGGIEPRTFHPSSKMKGISNKGKRQPGVEGVSTSRNFKFASTWNHSAGNFVLEFDQRRLAQRYKIVPFQYFQHPIISQGHARIKDWKGKANEYEEFIVTSKHIPLSFVNRLYVPERYIINENYKEDINNFRDKFGSSFIVVY